MIEETGKSRNLKYVIKLTEEFYESRRKEQTDEIYKQIYSSAKKGRTFVTVDAVKLVEVLRDGYAKVLQRRGFEVNFRGKRGIYAPDREYFLISWGGVTK